MLSRTIGKSKLSFWKSYVCGGDDWSDDQQICDGQGGAISFEKCAVNTMELTARGFFDTVE